MTDEDDCILMMGEELREARENKEWPEKYDDIPRYSDLSMEEKAERPGLGQAVAIATALEVGFLPPVGETITQSYSGDTKAEALGKAYITRDQIRDAGGSCEVEYIEPELIINPHLYHRIDITITDK